LGPHELSEPSGRSELENPQPATPGPDSAARSGAGQRNGAPPAGPLPGGGFPGGLPQDAAAEPSPTQPLPAQDGPAQDGPEPDGAEPKRRRAGRNLPAAVAVGLFLGALAIVSLFTVKFIFLIYMAAVVACALGELTRALAARGIRLPVLPIAVGGAVMLALSYWRGERALVAAFAVTAVSVLAWRMAGGSDGYLRDVTAGLFTLVYLPLMACFVGLMLAAPDGSRRTLAFLILTVCSDVGGYLVGSLFGRHHMAAVISPNKTWEGLAGSVLGCVVAGVLLLPLLLHGAAWQGVLVGLGAVTAAILGDLSESMIKRDLQIKDMGTVLPGHGGILDRIDSLLISAPVVWLLLMIFLR
jgi:phosphatidate cytidylyltransferase